MNKFYLNHYKWLEPIITLVLAFLFFIFIDKGYIHNTTTILEKILKANDSLFGAVASLLGFVFVTITILVGLGDNYRNNENTTILTKIIDRLSINNPIQLEEAKILKKTHTASSLFFSTITYSLTLKSLLGCVRILAIVSILSLIVCIFGKPNVIWATIIIFYLSYALLSIVRILILVKYLIHILTNDIRSDK